MARVYMCTCMCVGRMEYYEWKAVECDPRENVLRRALQLILQLILGSWSDLDIHDMYRCEHGRNIVLASMLKLANTSIVSSWYAGTLLHI